MSAGEMEGKMRSIEPTLTYDGFADVDIVIEAVPEKMEIKKRVLAELDAVVPGDARSSPATPRRSPSARWRRATKRPGKVIGMHFFNPAHVMKLVEIIPGLETGQETIDDVVVFTESLRKIAGGRAGVPRLPGQPAADALPERGDLVPAGGRGHRDRDRRGR